MKRGRIRKAKTVKRDLLTNVSLDEYERSVADRLRRLSPKDAAEVLSTEFGARRVAEVLARKILDLEDERKDLGKKRVLQVTG